MSAPSASTNRRSPALHDELMSLTLRMVSEHPQLPAGSVIRCVARAVGKTIRVDTPNEQIVPQVEHTARRDLAALRPEPTVPPLTISRALWF
jgi:hypothetical protein